LIISIDYYILFYKNKNLYFDDFLIKIRAEGVYFFCDIPGGEGGVDIV